MEISKDEIRAMTVTEKVALLNSIWEVMEENEYSDDADNESDQELFFLNERLAEYKQDPSKGMDWENALKRLRERKFGK